MKRRDLLKVLGLSPFVAKRVIEKKPEKKTIEGSFRPNANDFPLTACTVTWGAIRDEDGAPYMIEAYQVKRQK